MAKSWKVSDLRSMDMSTLSLPQFRKAYTVYRDVLKKRVDVLAKGTKAQRSYAAPFQKGGSKELFTLRQIDALPRRGWTEEQKRREMLHRVRELQIQEKKERSGVKGWQQIETRTIQTLHEAGYTGINKKNIRQFGDYMEALRSQYSSKVKGSPAFAELFSEWAEKKMSMDELLKNLEQFGVAIDGVDLFL